MSSPGSPVVVDTRSSMGVVSSVPWEGSVVLCVGEGRCDDGELSTACKSADDIYVGLSPGTRPLDGPTGEDRRQRGSGWEGGRERGREGGREGRESVCERVSL